VHAGEIKAILLAFLEVLDGLDRLVAAPDAGAARSLALLQRQLLAAFTAAGVTFVDSVGTPFDPHVHTAVETYPATPGDAGLVVQEIRRGCWWRSALLRPAAVVIAQ
jgi:molecular chaperone GrpE